MTQVPRPHRPSHTRLDAAALRTLAHPLRARLLAELRREGPATATTLAAVLDTNSGATSYHLRKLAEVGLVEQAPGGTGRERLWRAAQDMHSVVPSDFAGDPDSQAALTWLAGEGLRHFTDVASHWQQTQADWPDEWRDAGGASDYLLRLSAAQTAELMQELYAVIERYRIAEPGVDPARVILYLHAFPQPTKDQTSDPASPAGPSEEQS